MKNKFLKLLLISATFVFYSFNSDDKSIKSDREINNEKLEKAFNSKNLNDMEKILDAGNVDVDFKLFVDGGTALHGAALLSDIPKAQLLISKGANVDAIDNDENTPIITAVARNSFDLTKLLLENGASLVKSKFDIFDTFIFRITNWGQQMSAFPPGSLNLLQLLIKYGLNINYEDLEANNSRFIALKPDKYKKHREVIQEFLPALVAYNEKKQEIDAEFKNKGNVKKISEEYLISDLTDIVMGYAGYGATNPFEYFIYTRMPDMIKKYEALKKSIEPPVKQTSSTTSSSSSSSK